MSPSPSVAADGDEQQGFEHPRACSLGQVVPVPHDGVV
jgi:hypothetical protein